MSGAHWSSHQRSDGVTSFTFHEPGIPPMQINVYGIPLDAVDKVRRAIEEAYEIGRRKKAAEVREVLGLRGGR